MGGGGGVAQVPLIPAGPPALHMPRWWPPAAPATTRATDATSRSTGARARMAAGRRGGAAGGGGLKVCRKQRHSSTGTNSVRIPIADFEPNQTPVSTSGPRGLMVGCRFPPLPVPSTSLSDIPHRILFYIFPSISRWHHCDCSIDIAFGWQTEH